MTDLFRVPWRGADRRLERACGVNLRLPSWIVFLVLIAPMSALFVFVGLAFCIACFFGSSKLL